MSTREPWRNAAKLPTNLQAAHDYLVAKPAEQAPRAEWRDYYLYCADVYLHVARVDQRHHYEAGANAWCMKQRAAELGAQRDDADAELVKP